MKPPVVKVRASAVESASMRSPWGAVATSRTMATTIAAFFTVGAVAGVLLTISSDPALGHRPVKAALSVAALVAAVVVQRWGSRWPRWVFHLLVLGGAVLVDVAVLLADDAGTTVAAAALMSFIVFDAYLFFPPRQAAAHLAFGLSSVTVALLAEGDVAWSTALALVVTMLALGAASRNLVTRAADASRDALTGLLNRRGFDEALTDLVTLRTSNNEPLTAVLLDLDGFKTINDTRGHDAGDQVLQLIANTFSHTLPSHAVFARHGGDEFALLLPGLTGLQAVDLVHQARTGHPGVRLSAGIAQHTPGDSAAQLMRRADQALYTAKAAGRDRCELATPLHKLHPNHDGTQPTVDCQQDTSGR